MGIFQKSECFFLAKDYHNGGALSTAKLDGYYSAYPERDDKKRFARGIVKGNAP